MHKHVIAIVLLAFAACSATDARTRVNADLDALVCSDPAAWSAGRDGLGDFIELRTASDYSPPHRSLHSIALLAEHSLGSFELEFDALSTGRSYGHRDLCLIFGFQDPANYNYIHIAPAPDANAHNIFLVQDAPRRNLLEVQPKGFEWDDSWHHVRLVRDVESGRIAVYMDGSEEALIEGVDKTFTSGFVGLGSFDDTGRFRNIQLNGEAAGAWSPPVFK
ncbi:MAG: hypothetical protein ACI8QC_000535 [Planctomycetota bacterium]|jgi:hypothetical protein